MTEAKTTLNPDVAPDPAVEASLDEAAEAAWRDGRVVAHERVRAWLEKLANGERTPAPRA